MYQIVLLLLAIVGGSLSQVLVNGPCPISSGPTGSIASIQGTWYQIERINNPEERGECATTWFNSTITAISNVEVFNRTRTVRNGTITRPNNEPYRFSVTFPGDSLPRDYYLVGTNSNYAVIARCQQISTNNVTTTNLYAWKLGRRNSLTAADTTAINQHLSAIPLLASASWRKTLHTTAACRVSGAGSLAPSFVALVVAVLLAAKGDY